jgi:hypothetical protein
MAGNKKNCINISGRCKLLRMSRNRKIWFFSGRDDKEEGVSSYWMVIWKRQDNRRVSTRYHVLKNSLWKRLWTCRKTEYVVMMMMMVMVIPHQIWYRKETVSVWYTSFIALKLATKRNKRTKRRFNITHARTQANMHAHKHNVIQTGNRGI